MIGAPLIWAPIIRAHRRTPTLRARRDGRGKPIPIKPLRDPRYPEGSQTSTVPGRRRESSLRNGCCAPLIALFRALRGSVPASATVLPYFDPTLTPPRQAKSTGSFKGLPTWELNEDQAVAWQRLRPRIYAFIDGLPPQRINKSEPFSPTVRLLAYQLGSELEESEPTVLVECSSFPFAELLCKTLRRSGLLRGTVFTFDVVAADLQGAVKMELKKTKQNEKGGKDMQSIAEEGHGGVIQR